MRRFVSFWKQQTHLTCYDFKRNWLWIFAFITALLCGIFYYPATNIENPGLGYIFAIFFRPIACWGIVWRIVRFRCQGSSASTCSRTASLSALPSLFLFITLPLVASHLLLLNKLGIFPTGWLSDLIWRQIFFDVFFLLPAFGLILATRNTRQAAITVNNLVRCVGRCLKGISHSHLEPRCNGVDSMERRSAHYLGWLCSTHYLAAACRASCSSPGNGLGHNSSMLGRLPC